MRINPKNVILEKITDGQNIDSISRISKKNID